MTREMLTPTICRMKVEAPLLAASARPGQFLMVRADEKGERIPLTVSDYDVSEGSVTIVTQVIGVSTDDIVAHEPGQCFSDVTGPLGMPSDFVEMDPATLAAQRYIFVAGGVGTAPVFPQAKWLHAHGLTQYYRRWGAPFPLTEFMTAKAVVSGMELFGNLDDDLALLAATQKRKSGKSAR